MIETDYDAYADEIMRLKNIENDKVQEYDIDRYGNRLGFKKYRAGNNSKRPKPRKKKR